MATIKQRKRGGNWQLHWVQDGKQYRRSLLTSDRAIAERYRLAKAAELATGTRIIAQAVTLDDFLERYLVWYATSHPTANKARSVSCLAQMGADRLFPALHMDTLSKMFARDAKKAGVGGSIHKLRHTFCSHLVAAGVPLRVVQMLAGHSSITVTERYSHLTPASKLDAVKRMAL